MAAAPSVFKAALWMLGALASFSMLAIAGRALSVELTTWQTLFYRGVVGMIVLGGVLVFTGTATLHTRRFTQHFFRAIVHLIGQYAWFYAVLVLPLAQVFALEFTAPIWTALFAPFILQEKLTPRRLLAVAAGFTGVLVILRPGVEAIGTDSMIVLASAVFFALTHIMTKKLTRTDSAVAVLFYMTLIQLPISFVLATAEISISGWTMPSLPLWPWIVIVGSAALSAHYCLARAMAHADATVVVPMDFLRVPLIALVGFLFYAETIDWFVLAGSLFILGGNMLNLPRKSRPSVPG